MESELRIGIELRVSLMNQLNSERIKKGLDFD